VHVGTKTPFLVDIPPRGKGKSNGGHPLTLYPFGLFTPERPFLVGKNPFWCMHGFGQAGDRFAVVETVAVFQAVGKITVENYCGKLLRKMALFGAASLAVGRISTVTRSSFSKSLI